MQKQSPVRNCMATAAMLAFFVLVTPPATAQTPDGSANAGRLEGTWFTQVTVRDCQTGVPALVPGFEHLQPRRDHDRHDNGGERVGADTRPGKMEKPGLNV